MDGERVDRLSGCLLGMAVGDALGLPREGLSARRAARLYGPEIRHRLLAGRGMVSDDTEHACMAGQALLASGGDATRLARSLGWRLRGWLLGLPPAVGWGTLRAILRLAIGLPPTRSGVASAGNGPAMRAPIIGACLAGDPPRLRACVKASSTLTHRDSRAVEGALAVAIAAGEAARHGPNVHAPDVLTRILREVKGAYLSRSLERVAVALERGDEPAVLAARLGLTRGVSGYMLHTVPVVLHAWLRAPADPREAVSAVIRLGGDSDTTGAVVGALAGATGGAASIPIEWLDGILEWPRGVSWMRRMGEALARAFPEGRGGSPAPTVPLFWPAILPRNLVFLAVVLMHGIRRLLPPW